VCDADLIAAPGSGIFLPASGTVQPPVIRVIAVKDLGWNNAPELREQSPNSVWEEATKMSTAPQTTINGDETLTKIKKRLKRLSIGLLSVSLLLIIFTGLVLFLFWRKAKSIDEAQTNLRVDQAIASYSSDADFVQPTVNTIQFLRHGYSILFDKVEYTQNGLALTGQVGNPTLLWVSSLALNFTARPYPYKFRDKIAAGPWALYSDEVNIGSAQTTVGSLNPGSTSFFSVTIPNVKQTPDGVQIMVSFSGERYQYLGK